jgi:uncharacterized protein YukE
MGSTDTVNITPDMMRNALNVVSDYSTATNNLFTQLSDTVNGLIPGSFSGSAAEGFKFFFDNTITKAASEDLAKLLKALQDILEETLRAIPDTGGLDDELGDGNRQ